MKTDDATATNDAPNRPVPRLSIRRRLLFTTVLLGVLGLGQEGMFRFVFPLPEVDGFNRNRYQKLNLSDDRLKGALEKGTSNLILRVRSDPDGYRYDHRLNLYGFRDDDFSIEKPRDKTRVLFVGDSFVEGMGTDQNGTIPKRFASALKPIRPVEAINLGLSGIGFPEYVRIVRDAVPLLRPDTVFLVVFANDLPAKPYVEEADDPQPPFATVDRFRPRVVEVARRLRQGKSVPRFFHAGPFPIFEPAPSPSNPWTGHNDPSIDPRLVAAFRRGGANPWLAAQAIQMPGHLKHDYAKSGGADRHLARIDSICRDARAKLIVVYIPFPANVDSAYLPALLQLGYRPTSSDPSMTSPAYHAQQLHLRDVADRLRIPFLDLTEAYIEAEQTKGRMFWAYDGHCNPAGYRLAAVACARYWAKGIAPKPNRAVDGLLSARSSATLRR